MVRLILVSFLFFCIIQCKSDKPICEFALTDSEEDTPAVVLPLASVAESFKEREIGNAVVKQGPVLAEKNISYGNGSSKVDVQYYGNGERPTVLYFHEGENTDGNTSTTSSFVFTQPFFNHGWNVVSLEYTHMHNFKKDYHQIMKWMSKNAYEYNIDAKKIIVVGNFTGEHLALMTGLMSLEISKLAKEIPVDHNEMNIAAVVNFSGSRGTSSTALDDVCSILNRVNGDNPPVITLHGDHEQTVEISLLHKKLDKSGVSNRLVLLKDSDYTNRRFEKVFDFLSEQGIY